MEPKEKNVDTVCGYWCLYISSTSANEYSTQIIIIKKKKTTKKLRKVGYVRKQWYVKKSHLTIRTWLQKMNVKRNNPSESDRFWTSRVKLFHFKLSLLIIIIIKRLLDSSCLCLQSTTEIRKCYHISLRYIEFSILFCFSQYSLLNRLCWIIKLVVNINTVLVSDYC